MDEVLSLALFFVFRRGFVHDGVNYTLDGGFIHLHLDCEKTVDLQLENKVVLISGGAKGIGAAIVRAAAAEAAVPVIVDRDADASKHLHSEIRTSHMIIADLSSPADCQTAIGLTVEKFGRLDALVNNAGINDKVGLEHETPQPYIDNVLIPHLKTFPVAARFFTVLTPFNGDLPHARYLFPLL